ncbi:MAG: PEGA domain-containing protein [Candidatus Zixiibacteriota bacterium]|nr:MAG: PEGA domain-containing protein [candidate division Zixibacteria bacterium]
MRDTVRSVLSVVLVVGLLSTFLTCATIMHGTKQDVSISSSPDQAEVEVMTAGGVVVFTGNTPVTTKLQRKHEYDVFINLAGYQEAKVHISKEFDSIYLGNILCGGIIGMIIDAANGAMNKLEPDVISVTLVTALLDEQTRETYAVFRALDSDGQLRTLVIPLVKT